MPPIHEARSASLAVIPLILPLALVLALAGCGDSPDAAPPAGVEGSEEPQREDAIAVRVGPARQEALSSLYSTSATLRADKQATVTARTRGVLERLMVEEGDLVDEGQPLAHLENKEQIIGLEIARTAAESTERELERARRLFDQDLISQEDFETARRQAEEARHAAERAELDLSRTVIRAPFSGKVLHRHLDPGGTVSDGTPIYDLADLDPLFADINVPERHVGRLSPGQTVRLTGDASGEVVDAVIERIAPSVDPESGTVKVTVGVAATARLRPGAFVRVAVVIDTHPAAVVVPRSALVAEGRRWHLFRLEDDGETVTMLEIVPGFEEGDRVEILEVLGDEGGVEPGTLVVTVGASALNDGARVEVIDDPDASKPPSADGVGEA